MVWSSAERRSPVRRPPIIKRLLRLEGMLVGKLPFA